MIGKKRLALTTPTILEETIKNPTAVRNIEQPNKIEDIGSALVIESKSLVNLIEESINNCSNQALNQHIQQQQSHSINDQKSLE